jgi:hypothetical protein
VAKFRVIEGTVWEISAGSAEEAKAIYEAHFAGDENAIYSMQELPGDSYWYGTEYLDGAQAACSWLEEAYGEGIRETDAWATYMDDEEAGE